MGQRNQGGNHLGYDLREFYETEITYREAKFRRVNKTFEERNVGFIVYRPNKLTTTIFEQFAELLLVAINHNAFVLTNNPRTRKRCGCGKTPYTNAF